MVQTIPSLLTIKSKCKRPKWRNDQCRISPHEYYIVHTNFGPPIKLFCRYVLSSLGNPYTPSRNPVWETLFYTEAWSSSHHGRSLGNTSISTKVHIRLRHEVRLPSVRRTSANLFGNYWNDVGWAGWEGDRVRLCASVCKTHFSLENSSYSQSDTKLPSTKNITYYKNSFSGHHDFRSCNTNSWHKDVYSVTDTEA